jgi:CRP-like cAMP-binding protein
MQETSGATSAVSTLDLLRAYCPLRQFKPGDALRQAGHHYKDMHLVADGRVAVRLPDRDEILGTGAPVGEIGFLRGCAATATVVAQTDTETIVLEDATLARIERERPALIARLLRDLADTAEERISNNLTQASQTGRFTNDRSIEVYLCRNDEMLESAKRLRYEVYCDELGRNSPNADHKRRTISDDLDAFGHTFIALEDGKTIGTIRGNMSFEGRIGMLEELYGMNRSKHHPDATSVVTKFVVRKSRRGSHVSYKLISALTRFGLRNNMKECYIDSVPSLLHYYKALGFEMVAPKFFHVENGPSFPMRLDLVTHGEQLCRDPTALTQLRLYLKAQSIRLIDRISDRLGPRTAIE